MNTKATSLLEGTPGPLSAQFDGLLLDLDGVIYVGSNPIDRAVPVVNHLAETMVVGFVTNNAARGQAEVARHLTALGIACSADQVLTSAQLAADLLQSSLPTGAPVLVVGGSGLFAAIEDVGLQVVREAHLNPAAVVQGFGPDVGWSELAQASVAVASGVHWLATNLDATMPTPFGRALGNGALVQAVTAATGRTPNQVAGKPERHAFVMPAGMWGLHKPLVVGDRLDTDIAGANAAGYASLLVLSGVSTPTDVMLAPPGLRPDYLGRTLDDLLVAHPRPAIDESTRTDISVRVGRACISLLRDQWQLTGGGDPMDQVRAAVVAGWWAKDRGVSERVLQELGDRLRQLSPPAH